MNLDSTTKVLRIVLGEAKTTHDCNVVSSFADSGVGSFLLGNSNVNTNGVTAVTIVGAPGSSVQRQVKEIRLFNNDTISHGVTLELFDGTNTWIIGTTPSALPVPPNGSFVYTPEAGVFVAEASLAGVTSVVAGTNLNVGAGPGGTITTGGTLNLTNVPVVGGIIGNAATLTVSGLAGVGTGNGGQVDITGGASGTGATGNGGVMLIAGGTPRSTNGDSGSLVFSTPSATGTGNVGIIQFSVGSAVSGTPGFISFAGQPSFDGGTPTVPAGATIAGSDQAGVITVGAGATTSVPVTFGGNYSLSPNAVVISPANAAATASGVRAFTDTLSNTGWTLEGTALANCSFNYLAF